MSSAWLIRAFIDPQARFAFSGFATADQIAFDMYEGDFTHQGDACTFEVLVRRFQIDDAAVRQVAEIVHDLDLKDDKYRVPEGPTIGMLVEGVRDSQPDDARALETGMALFGALYRALATAGRSRKRTARPSAGRRAPRKRHTSTKR